MKQYFLTLLLGLFAAVTYAQKSGRVVDTEGRPVSFAGVVMLSLPDSAVLGGAVTDQNGRFRLKEDARARLLRVSLAGYATAYVPLEKGAAELGDIRLADAVASLGEAVVTARRPAVRLTATGLETQVAGTLLEQAGTAEDLLQKVPGLVMKDEKIEVIGKGTPVFYVNGRQVRDEGELRRLRSDEIRSVEVVRNPGARYDASTGAVVLIRTVRRQGEGFGLDATAQAGRGERSAGSGQLALNYRRGGLDLFASTYLRLYNGCSRNINDQITAVDTLWVLPFTERSDYSMHRLTSTFGLNYDFGGERSAGLRYELGNSLKDRGAGMINSDIMADGVYYDRLSNELVTEEDHEPEHSVNAYYAGRAGIGQLFVDADFYASGERQNQQVTEHSAEHDDRLVQTVSHERNRLVAGKARYELPLLGGNLGVGVQYTFTNRHDDYFVPANDWGVATARSQLREQNAAGFAEYSRLVKGVGQFSAGLRYEHVRFDYFEGDVRQADQSRQFSNFFPSLSLATQLGKVQMQLAYTAGTTRPGYSQLSNNVTYGNRFLMQGGNPTLRPTVKHEAAVTAVWKMVQGAVSFKQEKDAIIYWGTSLPERPATTKISYINKSYPSLTAMLSASPRVGLWQPTFSVMLLKQWFDMTSMGRKRRFDNPMFVGKWNNAFRLPAGFVLNVDYFLQSRGHYTNVRIGEQMHRLDLSLVKTFMKDALSLKLSGTDLLRSTPTNYILMEQSRFVQKGRYDSRRVELTLRYRFNATSSKYRGGGAAEEERRRL